MTVTVRTMFVKSNVIEGWKRETNRGRSGSRHVVRNYNVISSALHQLTLAETPALRFLLLDTPNQHPRFQGKSEPFLQPWFPTCQVVLEFRMGLIFLEQAYSR